jgi:hypothetical protein
MKRKTSDGETGEIVVLDFDWQPVEHMPVNTSAFLRQKAGVNGDVYEVFGPCSLKLCADGAYRWFAKSGSELKYRLPDFKPHEWLPDDEI